MTPDQQPQRVQFLTADGVSIVGDFFVGPPGGPTALLLHMMPATRESWREFAVALQAAGFTALAIDLRGHGESVAGPAGRLDYKLFEDSEHQDKIKDVEAAVRWLAERVGERGRHPVIVGASIGANLAIAYAAEHAEIPAVAALSPGLDYRGVTTADKVKRFRAEQGLFLAASSEDELSFSTDRELRGIKKDAVLKEYRGAGHGTRMFAKELTLMPELANWLARQAAS